MLLCILCASVTIPKIYSHLPRFPLHRFPVVWFTWPRSLTARFARSVRSVRNGLVAAAQVGSRNQQPDRIRTVTPCYTLIRAIKKKVPNFRSGHAANVVWLLFANHSPSTARITHQASRIPSHSHLLFPICNVPTCLRCLILFLKRFPNDCRPENASQITLIMGFAPHSFCRRFPDPCRQQGRRLGRGDDHQNIGYQ